MEVKVENINKTSRLINIKAPPEELVQQFDQVYKDIGKFARVPGYRPGRVPRDLLEIYYSKKAKEEVIKRAIPEYYLRAVKEENLFPVAPPEIENVQFKERALSFSAKVDVRPQIKLKQYKNLKIIRKKNKVEQAQVEQVLEKLRQTNPKEATNDALAKELGFASLEDLKSAVNKDLHLRGEIEIKNDMERQILEQLLKRASLDAPEALVRTQTKEILEQLKLNHILRGQKKEEVESKERELQEQAEKEALRRVKLSFLLEEIGQREGIQVSEEDLTKRIEEIARAQGKSSEETRQYLESQNLIPGIKYELKNKKIIELLLKEANIVTKE